MKVVLYLQHTLGLQYTLGLGNSQSVPPCILISFSYTLRSFDEGQELPLSVGILVEFALVWESGSRRFFSMSVTCPTTVVVWVYSTRQELSPIEGALSPIR